MRLDGAPVIAVAIAVALALAPTPADADGAFPDSESILTPSDRPQETILATNFGLIVSQDSDRVSPGTWTWSCEQEMTSYGHFYQLGPAPAHRLFAVSVAGLVRSDDLGCSWSRATGLLDGASALDVFPDPTSSDRVVAVARRTAAGVTTDSVVESMDGGARFTMSLFDGPPGDTISGVEIARSDPRTIYVALSNDRLLPAKLARSGSDGAFMTFDLPPALLDGQIRLLAVDAQDPRRVFLRWNAAAGDHLVITSDGGATARVALDLSPGTMTAFALLDGGTIVVAANIGGQPALFRSRDGGLAFEPLPGGPHLRALSVRGGLLYGAGDNTIDKLAIATSADEGSSWQPLMAYADVQAVAACVTASCRAGCQIQSQFGLWPAAVCGAPPAPDGGVGRDAGGGAADDDGTADADADADANANDAPISGRAGGCRCAAALHGGRADGWRLLLAALLASGRVRRGAARQRRDLTRARSAPHDAGP